MAKRKPNSPRLSRGEIELLEILWANDGVTIMQVQDALGHQVGYTTVQTRLDRLVGKGLATKTKDRPGKYQGAIPREQVSGDDLSTLVRHVTGGRVVPLIAHLLQDGELTQAEITEVRELIRAADRRRREK